MTPSVSTSSGKRLLVEPLSVAVSGGVVGHAVDPAAVDDANPGSREDAYGVWVVVAAGAGIGIDLRGPGAGMPTVVGEGRDGLSEALLQAQRKCTAWCLPDLSVTGVWPARAATASGES